MKKILWTEINKEYLTLSEEGDSIEGLYVDQHPGKYGPIITLETEAGMKDLPLSTVLQTKFEHIPQGRFVRITFLGKVVGEEGRKYNDYKVEIGREEEDEGGNGE